MCSGGGPPRSEETPALEGGAGSSPPWVTGLCWWESLPSVSVTPSFPSRRRGVPGRGWAGEDGLQDRDAGGLVWIWWYTGPAEGREGLAPEGSLLRNGVGVPQLHGYSAGG